MREFFYDLTDEITALLRPGEQHTCQFSAEDSDFVRLNENRIRQAGHVRQLELSLDLMEGRHHCETEINLTGDLGRDRELVKQVMETLRAKRRHTQEDPYLLVSNEVRDSEEIRENQLPLATAVIPEILAVAEGLDLVGIWASGTQYRGFANSIGQRNWYSNHSFNLDWSCHTSAGKAVKSTYSGTRWDRERFRRMIETDRTHLQTLVRPEKQLAPGRYRCYLAPAALQEIVAMMAWGGFGLKSHRTAQTPLIKMIESGVDLHPAIHMVENHALGLTPRFTPAGFIKPTEVNLIERGRYRDCLVGPRSAMEYDAKVNAAYEFPESLQMSTGQMPENDVLARLDRGLYINNLWYCNFSDRNDCRITGMTRYACFWVENGKLVAPIDVMRFDDSIYRMLGDKFIDLTKESRLIMDTETYGRRSTACSRLPGVLFEDFNLTL